MPAGEDQERERFAVAVEHGLDAVPPNSDADGELLQELELVALLRQSRVALAPSADESARMRARVMAAAATMLQPASEVSGRDEICDTLPNGNTHTRPGVALAPGVDADAETWVDTIPIGVGDDIAAWDESTNVVPIGRAGRGRHRFPSQQPGRRSRGLLGISAAAAVMVLAVAGSGAMFSQAALPGDSLYGIKQTTESALVGLTPGQGNKAQRQLDYASTRIDEAQKVNSESAPDNEKAADISQALKGFDDQAEDGSKLWLNSANSGSSADNSAHLSQLSGWAQRQNQRLSSMRTSMPASAQPDADHSMRLMEDLRTRAQSLNNRKGCDRVTTGKTDELGPIPAKGPCKVSTATNAPNVKSVVPSTTESRTTAPSESSSSSSESSSRPEKDNSDQGGTNQDTRPALPILPNLTDGSGQVLPNSVNQKQSNNLVPPQKATNGGLLGNLLKPLVPKPSNQ
jgi:hypothetical protein